MKAERRRVVGPDHAWLLAIHKWALLKEPPHQAQARNGGKGMRLDRPKKSVSPRLRLLVVLPVDLCWSCGRPFKVCPTHRVCQPCHLAAINKPEPYRAPLSTGDECV